MWKTSISTIRPGARYLVVQTGSWLAGRRVLISPRAVERLDHDRRRVELSLTRDQVDKAPGIETALPVSRQQEMAYHDYFGYPYYWAGAGLWGAAAHPLPMGEPDQRIQQAARQRAKAGEHEADPHLRSSSEVRGYQVEAGDGSGGHLDALLVDDSAWTIRYAVVDTKSWWPGGQVLVDPQRIAAVDWNLRQVRLDLSREELRSTPPYRAKLEREDLCAGENTTISTR